MQEIATVLKDAASLHGHVPGHLLHPRLIRVDGDPGDVNLAAFEMDEKQHVVGYQSSQREDLRREKVPPVPSMIPGEKCRRSSRTSALMIPGRSPLAPFAMSELLIASDVISGAATALPTSSRLSRWR